MAAITCFSMACVEQSVNSRGLLVDRLIHKISPSLDLIVGIAIVIFAILGMQQVLPMAPEISHILLGLGSCYTGISILSILLTCKYDRDCSKDFFLFKAPSSES